jgi:hypothetical protein
MKDDADRFPIGYIVARAAQTLSWESAVADDNGVKRARISVLFESFVRDSRGSVSLAERDSEIAELRADRDDLERRLAPLERLAAPRVALGSPGE